MLTNRRQFLQTATLLPALRVARAAGPAATRHVVLVSIDGLAAYQLLDEDLEIPNIRQLIRRGVWAASSETVYPSVTHPSHTSMVTGVRPLRHGVVGNSLVDRHTGEKFHITDKPHRESVRVPTLFDAAKANGLTTAAFYWPESKADPSIDYNLVEAFTPDGGKADIEATPARFLDELRKADVPIDLFYRWYGSERAGAGDVVLTEAAAHVIRAHKPALLAIHLVSTDKAQHAHGPRHYLSRAAITNADHCVGLLRQAIEDAGIAGETTIIVGADHGFHSVYEEVNIHPIFRETNLLEKVRLHGRGWQVFVELTSAFDPAADMPALHRVFNELRLRGLVHRVISPGEMHDVGLPRYEESPYLPGQYVLVPDIDTHLAVDPSSSSTERRPKKSPSHSHGYLPGHPRMYPALVIAGAGIRTGITIGHVSNLDLAPTVATLLGIEMKDVEGRTLTEALSSSE